MSLERYYREPLVLLYCADNVIQISRCADVHGTIIKNLQRFLLY